MRQPRNRPEWSPSGAREWAPRFVGIYSKWPHQRSKGIQRSNCFRNAPWPTNLVGRTFGQSVMHCWGQKSCRGKPGSTRGQIVQECPMATKLVGRTPDQSVKHCWGQRSCRGQLGSVRGQIRRNYLQPSNVARATLEQTNLTGALVKDSFIFRTSSPSFHSRERDLFWKRPM